MHRRYASPGSIIHWAHPSHHAQERAVRPRLHLYTTISEADVARAKDRLPFRRCQLLSDIRREQDTLRQQRQPALGQASQPQVAVSRVASDLQRSATSGDDHSGPQEQHACELIGTR